MIQPAAGGAGPAPRFQATLAAPFEGAGAGLHTGKRAVVRVGPADPGVGVVFRRRLSEGSAEVRALWRNRRSRPLCTALQSDDGVLVRTVEHLLAALSALRIDNALVEIDAEELPIFDGSAAPWVERINAVGRREQDVARTYIRIRRKVEHRDGRRVQRLEPAPAFALDVGVTLSHFGRLNWSGAVNPETFAEELAPSRSFGRLKWTLGAKLAGLFSREPVLRGANFGNTAALWGRSAIGGLRMPDEPVRHRALDVVGDLALAGFPILGKATARHPSHDETYRLVEKLMSTPDAWDLVEIDDKGGVRPVTTASG